MSGAFRLPGPTLAALLLTGALSAAADSAPAGEWVYPDRDFLDAEGRMVYPTTDGRRFESALAREEYLRQHRELRRRDRDAAAEAERRRRAAETEPLARPLRPRPVPLPPERLDDRREEELRAGRAAALAAQQARQRRLGEFLARAGRSDAAETRAALAAERAARSRRVTAGLDRLYSGAEAARETLGESERRPRGPLIRGPRVTDFE